MFGLIKGLAVVALGIGGIGAVVYGVTSKSPSNYWDNWKKTLKDADSPVLSCGDSFDKYEGVMKVSEDGKNDMGLGLTIDDFKVTHLNTRGTTFWTRRWGDNVKGEHDWMFWKIGFSTDKKEEDLLYWEVETKGGGFTSDQKVVGFSNSKIKLKESERADVENKYIRFDINKDNCQFGTDSVTCDIVFASGSKVEWVEGFKPKITYTKPSR